MPFGPFLSQQQKDNINNSMYKNAPAKKPERTQAQKTADINKGVTEFFGLNRPRSTGVGPGGGRGFGLGSNNTKNTPTPVTPYKEVYGDPTPTIQPGNRPRGPMFMDPVGPSREMPGASSFMDPVAPKDADVTQLATKPGRQILPKEQTVVNAAGVVQTGKNLSGGAGGGGAQDFRMSGGVDVAFVPEYANSSFNDLLAGVNTSGYQPFGSNQLPTTEGSPDSGITPKTQAIIAGSNPDTNIGPVADGQEYANNLGRQGTKGIGPVADGQVYGNTLENAPGAGTKGIGPLVDGDAYARAVEGKGKSTSRLDAALNDKAGINSYMSKFSSGDQERLANRAFLDGDGSMAGLRAKEAVNGVVYAGGNHYVAGESADSPAVRIDRSNARDISNGKARAEQFKAKKVADTVAAIKQEPATIENPGMKQSFSRAETLSAPINTSIPDNVEFNSNNDNPLPAFDKTGGHKSGFKRINTTMTNPFGG